MAMSHYRGPNPEEGAHFGEKCNPTAPRPDGLAAKGPAGYISFCGRAQLTSTDYLDFDPLLTEEQRLS
jgi:hypothetical protein